ncbi:MAG: hypothetical protein H6539_04710 [Bacteroidales bacterium]|nr:hypothetical protein [Bacteroidales bacterium]
MATKKIVKSAAPAAKKPAAKKTSAVKKVADIEAIRRKAEEIYHARVARGEHGTAEGDWHAAEKIILDGSKKPAAKKPVAKKPAAKKK